MYSCFFPNGSRFISRGFVVECMDSSFIPRCLAGVYNLGVSTPRSAEMCRGVRWSVLGTADVIHMCIHVVSSWCPSGTRMVPTWSTEEAKIQMVSTYLYGVCTAWYPCGDL